MIERLLIVVLLASSALILIYAKPQRTYIDCSLASFHPDYTQEQRELCRKLRQKQSEPREKS